MTCSRKSRSQLFLLEASVFLLTFSSFLSSILLLNQLLKQACISFGYEKSLCDVISENDNQTAVIESELQPYVARINLVMALIHSSVPAILQLFLGPWSDKHGRKTVLNFASIGFVLTHISTAAVCFYSEHIYSLSPWVYVLCYIPVNFLGGFPAVLTATLCFITDTCEESRRSYHFTLVEMTIVFSVISGALMCSLILSLASALFVFATAALCAIIAAFIVIVFIDESVEVIESSSKQEGILSKTHISEMISTCFRPRALYDRWILLSLVLIVMCNRFALDAGSSVGYLFSRVQFNWTLQDNNSFHAASTVMTVLGTSFALLVLKKIFGFSELFLISVAVASNLVDNSLRAFAYESWHMYAISALSNMRLITQPLCRALISTIVSQNEIGKVMSFTSSFEAIANFLAPSVYVAVYEATFTSFAGAFFLIAAGTCFVNLFIVFGVMIMRKTTTRHEYIEID